MQSFNMETFIANFSNSCDKCNTKQFKKSDIITTYIEKRNQICILIDGEADLIRYDFNGNKTIIGHFRKNDVFGETFYPAKTNNELFVLAKKNCSVLFFNYDIIENKCKKRCLIHDELLYNINSIILGEIIKLNTRIEVLTQKTTRDKLLSYFNILSSQKLIKKITLPLSMTDLADFLSVDRSAMTRELTNLKKEGFIKQDGNKITLLI